jgi:Na+/proline symporter
MKSIKKTLLYGFLVWLLPFAVAIPFYSRDGQPLIDIFLLKSIMIIVGSVAGAVFLILYFKKVTENYLREGLIIGLIWLAINWILDFIILVPMANMDIGTYFAQIGLRYLTIPIFSVTIGLLLNFQKAKK